MRLRSDDQLVALFRLGNDEAFRVIHDRYRQRLYSYARQMLAGSRSDAEDALQDVFLRAYHALRADDRPVTLRAWLYRVAHNRCIDQLRRPAANVVELFDTVRSLHDPIDEAQRREDLRRLVADVRRLPEQQRSALLMREMEGLSYQELADALEVTLPAVKSLLVRARMGLVEAQTARDTACVEIRADLALAHDRGVRASGLARRHLRECTGCRDYRATLKGVASGFSALQPSAGGWGLVAKLFGLGGAGSGAAAGGTAAAGGGMAATGTVAVGGGAAAVTATKVAAVVCCAALVGGGAAEVKRATSDEPRTSARTSTPASAARQAPPPAPIATQVLDRPSAASTAAPAAKRRAAKREAAAPAVKTPDSDDARRFGGLSSTVVTYEERAAANRAGGILAPDEEVDPVAPEHPTASEPGTTVTGSVPILSGSGSSSGSTDSGTTGGGSGAPTTSGSGTTNSGSGSTGASSGPSGSTTGGSTPVAQGASAAPPPAG